MAWSAANCLKDRAGRPRMARHVVGDPLGVAVGRQAERLGVHLGDRRRDAGPDHRVPVLVEAELGVGDGPAEELRQDRRDVVVGDQLRAGEPVGLPGVGGGRGGDLGGRPRRRRGRRPCPARPLPAEEPKPLVAGDRGRQRQDVLHVGVGPQQRVGQAGGGQAGLDLGLAAPPGDRRVGRRLAAGLDDVPDAGPDGARDDVQLLRGHGRADQDDRSDARHRLVDARRDVQVADGDLGPRVGQRLRLVWVACQHADGHLPQDQRAHGFGADLPGRRYEDHDVVLFC